MDLADQVIVEICLREINEAHQSKNWLRLRVFSESLAKFLGCQEI